jgi:YHS domain-containing protein
MSGDLIEGGGEFMAKDPVCKMEVNEKTSKLKSDYNGKTYYFCNPNCKSTFEKNPAKYVK